MDYTNITVQYCLEDDGTNSTNTLKVTENTVVYFVPTDPNNTDYQAIQEWVAEGNTIEEAD